MVTRDKQELKEDEVYKLYRTKNSAYIVSFQKLIWEFYKTEKRDFPWRSKITPYKILVSEFMLQQTQTIRVIDYFQRFIKEFPSIEALAQAPQSSVIRLWSGLGYNRRAIQLHKTAKIITNEHNGRIPKDLEILQTLPGIGPSTANAIRIFAYTLNGIIVETNTRTVIKKIFFPRTQELRDAQVAKILEEVSPIKNIRDWNYALMDYGVYLKSLGFKLNSHFKSYTPQSVFKGSKREIRGAIIKSLVSKSYSKLSLCKKVSKELGIEEQIVGSIIESLVKEEFLVSNKYIKLKN